MVYRTLIERESKPYLKRLYSWRNEERIKGQTKEQVRGSLEETRNAEGQSLFVHLTRSYFPRMMRSCAYSCTLSERFIV